MENIINLIMSNLLRIKHVSKLEDLNMKEGDSVELIIFKDKWFISTESKEKFGIPKDMKNFQYKLLKGFNFLPHQSSVMDRMFNMIDPDSRIYGVRKYGITGGILALDTGLGKTMQILLFILKQHSNRILTNKRMINTILNTLRKKLHNDILNKIGDFLRYKPKPTLIVVPKTAVYTWEKEFKKFFSIGYSDNQISYKILHSEYTNLKTISDDTFSDNLFLITTYDMITNISKKEKTIEDQISRDTKGKIINVGVPIYSDELKEKFPLKKGINKILYYKYFAVILDESHRITNIKTERFRSMMCLHAEQKWGMTGTMTKNNACSDIYAQLRFLGYNGSTAKSFTINDFHKEKLNRFIIKLTKEDSGIDIPELESITEFLELGEEEEKIYNSFFSNTGQLFQNFKEKVSDYVDVLALVTRLRQICVAPFIISNKETKEKETFTHKILKQLPKDLMKWMTDKSGTAGLESTKIRWIRNKIQEIISESNTEKIIVFTNFTSVIKLLQEALDIDEVGHVTISGEITGKKRFTAIDNFKKDPTKKVLLSTLKTGSESLNLADVANHAIISEEWWTPDTQDQASGRIHRNGQLKKTFVYTLLIKNSIEERIRKINNDKREDAANLLINTPSIKGAKMLESMLL